LKENEVELGEEIDWLAKEFEDGFRVTIRMDDFRELIHALHYVNTDKDYIVRFPMHTLKQCEIIPKLDELLSRVEKAIAEKKIEVEKRYDVESDKSGVKHKGEDIHNGGS
jgi:hypothetical protein